MRIYGALTAYSYEGAGLALVPVSSPPPPCTYRLVYIPRRANACAHVWADRPHPALTALPFPLRSEPSPDFPALLVEKLLQEHLEEQEVAPPGESLYCCHFFPLRAVIADSWMPPVSAGRSQWEAATVSSQCSGCICFPVPQRCRLNPPRQSWPLQAWRMEGVHPPCRMPSGTGGTFQGRLLAGGQGPRKCHRSIRVSR